MSKRKLDDWKTDKALQKKAMMIAHKPFKWSRGWWVREFHSNAAMQKYLSGEWRDRPCFGDTGSFETEEEARRFALFNELTA
jgi:hypothetical protein